ncbi:hypothetical protein H849_13262 [Prescottella equi NBRC 101255 = C 7]|nr:hypothetical protein H849_13262 [Prescottella equi NBRC 101255 = C 7]
MGAEYPGIEEYLTPFQIPAFTVPQESTVISILGD